MSKKPSPQKLLAAIKEAHRLQLQDILETLSAQVEELIPSDFEKLVLKVVKRLENVSFGRVTQYSRDGGIDGYVSEDAAGRRRVPFQAKRFKSTIGAPAVQQFCGAMTDVGAENGVFITTSSFSPDAKRCDFVRKGKLVLIDGALLAEWMYFYDIGVLAETSITLKILAPHGFQLDG
ncbi:MAG: restriction endonuclease [Akkermansiaceae bacterium]|nr:restriction endonuclease [Akkermansiaceae bacterium]MCF7732698.1 restriction endonuclease [Akkermansiaceae bacterium]